MGEVRLGKIHLRWCDTCNVPVLEQASCDKCGTGTREVAITPPGDARPAFTKDIERIRAAVDRQFGHGCGKRLLPDGKIVLLNKAPDLDRMDEVIVDGSVAGAMRSSLVRREAFLLRPYSAKVLAPHAERSWVVVDKGAVDAIRDRKASALAVGILDRHPDIQRGDEVLVLNEDRKPISVGVSKMSSQEMSAPEVRGTAVKTRWAAGDGIPEANPISATWEDALSANRNVLSRRIREATRFIKKVVEENDLPVAVSYSGGKDSLATLLLVLESGIRPKMLFVDTGLEFEETKKNVEKVAGKHSLELLIENAGNAFWTNLKHFGPPAKDFRWCCKTCKLGPATRLIEGSFPGGVLSFIGQRAYESEQRARTGRVWRNPWIPNQLAASPIQKWTALHVWLYLFDRDADFNPLYETGLERIGCMMCPATDLAELRVVRDKCPEYARWQESLERYAEETGKDDAYLKYDLWRWKRVPNSVLDELAAAGVSISPSEPVQNETDLEFKCASGYNPCVEGLSMEGVFSRSLDMTRVANLMNIIGPVTTSPDIGIAETQGITVFAEGAVMMRGRSQEELSSKAARIREIVFRAMGCAGCGICASRCELDAISTEERVIIDSDACVHCEKCLGPCPVTEFREDQLDI